MSMAAAALAATAGNRGGRRYFSGDSHAEGRVVWAALRQAHLLVKGATVVTGAPVEARFF